MSDDRATFEMTRARLEDIVGQVRRKDVSLEQSLDMLEEAVRLVNQCNELIDQTSFKPAPVEGAEEQLAAEPAEPGAVEVLEVVELVDSDGDGEVDLGEIVEVVAEPSGEAEESSSDDGAGDEWGSVDAWDSETPAEPSADAEPDEPEDDARE